MNRLTTLGKALVVFFTGLAIAAAVTLVSARSSSREPAAGAARASGALSARAQATDDLSADDTAAGAAPIEVAFVVFAPSHGSSPRIIHVPQSDERGREASANSGDEAVAIIEQGDDTPPPRHRVIPLPRRSDAPAPQRRAAAPAPQRQADIAPMAPHRDVTIMQKLKPPQPVVNLPPPQAQPMPAGEADAKLTPVYPTPRYDNKLETESATATAPVPPPPAGYAPPSALPYRSN